MSEKKKEWERALSDKTRVWREIFEWNTWVSAYEVSNLILQILNMFHDHGEQQSEEVQQ